MTLLSTRTAPITCERGMFRCDDGLLCISLGWLCDNDPDCIDQSDEAPSRCEYEYS